MLFDIFISGAVALSVYSFIVWQRSRQELLHEESVFDTVVLTWFAGICAARLAFILFHFDAFGYAFLRWILFIYYPGFSLAGGVLGGIGALVYCSNRFKLPYARIIDSSAIGFLAAASCGFFIRFLYRLALMLRMPETAAQPFLTHLGSDVAVQAYVALSFGLLGYSFRALERKIQSPGLVGALALLASSTVLFLVDFLRSARVYYGVLQYEQILAIGLFVVSLALIVSLKKSMKKKKLSKKSPPLASIDGALKKDMEETKKALKSLKSEDPFTNPDHLVDNASDADAFEQSAHFRIESLSKSLRNKLSAITAARERIHAGTYGICELCGAKIPHERLEAMPTATICISCEKNQEEAVS